MKVVKLKPYVSPWTDEELRSEEATGPIVAHLAGGTQGMERYLAMRRAGGRGVAPVVASVKVPVRAESESNMREPWQATHRRNKAQQEAVGYALLAARWPNTLEREPWHVHLTRYGKGKLDSGNLEGSFKHVQDGIAKFLGIDDGDDTKVSWSYGQLRAPTYSVRVDFYRREVR